MVEWLEFVGFVGGVEGMGERQALPENSGIVSRVVESMRRLPYPMKVIVKATISPRYYFRIVVNDLRARLGCVAGDSHVIFVAGYPKSGTTWVENFISSIPGYSPRVLYGDKETIRNHGLPVDAFAKIPRYGYSSIKTHVGPNEQNISILIKNGINKVLVMYRDPRDIVVSNYYYILKNNPWTLSDPYYADYSKMEKSEGMSHSLQMTIEDYCAWVSGWRRVPDIHPNVDCFFLRYEDLRNAPRDTFARIVSFFGIDLSDDCLDVLISQASGGASVSVMPGKRSTMRKGVFGEWKTELNDRQKDVVKKKAGDLLVELGYEESLDWS